MIKTPDPLQIQLEELHLLKITSGLTIEEQRRYDELTKHPQAQEICRKLDKLFGNPVFHGLPRTADRWDELSRRVRLEAEKGRRQYKKALIVFYLFAGTALAALIYLLLIFK